MHGEVELSLIDDHMLMDFLQVTFFVINWPASHCYDVISEVFVELFNFLDVDHEITAELGVTQGILKKLGNGFIHHCLSAVPLK